MTNQTYNQLGLTPLPVDRPMTEAEVSIHDAEMKRWNERERQRHAPPCPCGYLHARHLRPTTFCLPLMD